MSNDTFTVKTAPFASGKVTTRQFNDFTFAVPYKQNGILQLSSEVADPSAAFARLKALGIYPSVKWLNGAAVISSSGNYVVSAIELSHSRAVANNPASINFNTWDVVLFIEPNPYALYPEVNFQTTHYQETVTQNLKATQYLAANAPITNTAKLPFSEAIEENKGRLRMEVTRNFNVTSFAIENFKKAQYCKSASQVTFNYFGVQYTFLANQLYCTDVRVPLKYDPITHYEVTMAFEVDNGFSSTGSQGDLQYWVRHPLNQGYYYLPGGTGQPQLFKAKGTNHGGQHPLAANGDSLPDGQAPIFLDVETIPEFEFNTIAIFPGT